MIIAVNRIHPHNIHFLGDPESDMSPISPFTCAFFRANLYSSDLRIAHLFCACVGVYAMKLPKNPWAHQCQEWIPLICALYFRSALYQLMCELSILAPSICCLYVLPKHIYGPVKLHQFAHTCTANLCSINSLYMPPIITSISCRYCPHTHMMSIILLCIVTVQPSIFIAYQVAHLCAHPVYQYVWDSFVYPCLN